MKLFMQGGILVAQMVRHHDLSKAWITDDQFDVTKKDAFQHPNGRWAFLIAPGVRPDLREPVLQPADNRGPNCLLGRKVAEHCWLGQADFIGDELRADGIGAALRY